MPEQYRFTDDFQDLILACMAAHPEKFAAVGSVVQAKYFWSQESAVACLEMQRYQEKYNFYPSLQALTQLVVSHYPRDEQDKANEAREYIKKLMRINTRDVDSVVEHTVQFAREMALIRAVREAAQRLHDNDWPEEGFAPMFEKAVRIGENLTDIGYSAYDDADAVLAKVMAVEYGVKSGYSLLDNIWYGRGWAPGWLIVPLAPPKSYKSAFCINLALNMVSTQGGNNAVPVLYYACEISAELALMRAYSNLTRWPSQDIYNRKNINKFKRALRETLVTHFGAPLIVKSFPAKTATIADIRAHAKIVMSQLTHNGEPLKPRVIIIDHAETIKPMASSDKDISDWRQQADIYTAARALGDELGCTIIMPDRCTREAAERATPSMTSFQGAFEKAGIVDVAFGICQSPEERSTNCLNQDDIKAGIKQRNKLRLFLFLNRHGKEYAYFEGEVCPEIMRIDLNKTLDWSPEEELRGRNYKNYKNKGADVEDTVSSHDKKPRSSKRRTTPNPTKGDNITIKNFKPPEEH